MCRNKGTSLKSLVDSLGNVWRKFLEMVSASGTDFLSLQHLGIVLACLADRGQCSVVIFILNICACAGRVDACKFFFSFL
jgi:hypothetical protein